MQKEIKLKNGNIAIVDEEDFWYLCKFEWDEVEHERLSYARCGGALMHRVVMGNPSGLVVDHIDHNGLNNVKSNLRVCTSQENLMNRRKNKNSASKYKGVSFNCGTWRARIMKNQIEMYIGRYKTENEAGLAYNKKAIELFGEYAELNNVQ